MFLLWCLICLNMSNMSKCYKLLRTFCIRDNLITIRNLLHFKVFSHIKERLFFFTDISDKRTWFQIFQKLFDSRPRSVASVGKMRWNLVINIVDVCSFKGQGPRLPLTPPILRTHSDWPAPFSSLLAPPPIIGLQKCCLLLNKLFAQWYIKKKHKEFTESDFQFVVITLHFICCSRFEDNLTTKPTDKIWSKVLLDS